MVGYEPYSGRVDVEVSRNTSLRIRKLDGIKTEELMCFYNGGEVVPQVKDGFLEFKCSDKNMLSIRYPLKEKKVKIVLRNPGCEGIGYDVRWRGSTVIELNPLPGNERLCEVEMPDTPPIKTYYSKRGVFYPLHQRVSL